MSALTSSPSPAASPRSSLQVLQSRRPSSTEALARSSPRLTFAGSSSPKRAFRAPAPPPSTVSSPATRRQRQESGESSSVDQRVRYVHAGTQYSPEGLPPTAGRTLARTTVEQPPGPSGSVGKKRKEREQQQTHQRGMDSFTATTARASPVDSSAAAAASADSAWTVPPEADSRVSPEGGRTSGAAAATPSSPSSSHGAEPQEARSTHGHSSAPKRSRPAPGSVKMMPQRYWTCNPKDLGVLISSMLMELIRLNDQIPLRDGRLTRFHSRAPPGISVSDYLQRLIHHATLSPPILLSMVWYIDRLCQLYPAFTINSLTVHRFLITAATVAAKGLSDSFWTNPTYARIGGIPVSELATLELEFLQKVQWKIVPKPEILEDYYRSLVDRTEGYALERPSGSSSSDTSSIDDGEDVDEDVDEKMADGPT